MPTDLSPLGPLTNVELRERASQHVALLNEILAVAQDRDLKIEMYVVERATVRSSVPTLVLRMYQQI